MTGAFFWVDCVLTASSGMDSERIFTHNCRKYRNIQKIRKIFVKKLTNQGVMSYNMQDYRLLSITVSSFRLSHSDLI